MRLQLSKNERIILLLVSLLSLVALLFLYFFLIKPENEKLLTVEKKVQNEEALLASIEARIQSKQKVDNEGTLQLQKRLPVDPLIEQFLLELEKAETISGSFITSMDFGEEDVKEASTSEDDYIEAAQGEDNSEEDEVGEESGEEAQPEDKPEGIESISVLLTVEASTYFELEAFLSEIEQSDRITKIDELSFSGNKEVITTEDAPDKLTYTVRVTTFYYPNLADLKEQLPSLDLPAPSEKINPLVPVVPKTSVENTEEIQSEELESNQSTTEATPITYTKHTVQSGETLYSISQKYYDDRIGEALIKEANALTNNRVYTGQVLKIPIEEK